MSGQRYRVTHPHGVPVPTPVGGGYNVVTTVPFGGLIPADVPADKVAHLLSVKMIEPVAGSGEAVETGSAG